MHTSLGDYTNTVKHFWKAHTTMILPEGSTHILKTAHKLFEHTDWEVTTGTTIYGCDFFTLF